MLSFIEMVLWLILVASFVLRLILSPTALHVDLLSNAEWGQWIYQNGTKGFFENTIWTYSWPTQPPLANLLFGLERLFYQNLLEIFRNIGHSIVAYHLAPGHMRWWFNFTIWFDQAKFDPVIVFPKGYIATMKLLPIIADIGIAGTLYRLSEKVNKGKGIIFSSIYLISPFSWYLSALWGQTDQLAFLFVLAAFLLEFQNLQAKYTPFLLVSGILIKPTSIILIPMFILVYLRNKHRVMDFLVSVTAILGLFWVTTKLFSGEVNPMLYSLDELIPKIFLKSEFRVSTNAFNFWRVIIGNKAISDQAPFLLIPAKIWGWMVYAVLNVLAFMLTKKVNLKNGFAALFLMSAGSFLFMTNMLDRYYFAGVVVGLFLCVYYPKLIKYWFIISLIFWLNLFNQWWYPEWLKPLENILRWQSGFLTRVLALVNVLIFLIMTLLVTRKQRSNPN